MWYIRLAATSSTSSDYTAYYTNNLAATTNLLNAQRNGTERNGQQQDLSLYVPQYFVPQISTILSRGSLDCTLRHILFYQRMLERKDSMALILEDDICLLTKNLPLVLKKIVEEARNLPKSMLISLENSTLKFPPRSSIRKGQYLYKAQRSRCAGAYILDFGAAQNIMDYLQTNKCSKVNDHWFNELSDAGVVQIYWAHPPCVEQGSHNGMSQGVNSTAKATWRRRITWSMQKFYKQQVLWRLRK